MNKLANYVTNIPDFPSPGICFRDISHLLSHHFEDTINSMLHLFTADELKEIDAFVGLDARGFIFAAAMAQATGKGFVMARKSGKLPPPLKSCAYALEYGQASLDMKPGQGNVIIVDDVLATGGTLKAAADLCEQSGYQVKGFGVFINLTAINNFVWNELVPRAVMTDKELDSLRQL